MKYFVYILLFIAAIAAVVVSAMETDYAPGQETECYGTYLRFGGGAVRVYLDRGLRPVGVQETSWSGAPQSPIYEPSDWARTTQRDRWVLYAATHAEYRCSNK